MLRIDFYVQHLVTHGATRIELLSGELVRFRFPTGDRSSAKPIEHSQIAQVVQEAGPPRAMEELRTAGKTSFAHESTHGITVQVTVEAGAPGSWRVVIEPATSKPAPTGPKLPDPPTARTVGIGRAEPQRTPDAKPEPARAEPAKAEPEPPPAEEAPAEERPVFHKIEAISGEPRINYYLRLMKAYKASDLHLSSTVPAMARIDGAMRPIEEHKRPLNNDELRAIFQEIMPETNREEFEKQNDTDFAHMIPGLARFRANIFRDRHGVGGVFRQIPFDILTVEQLGIPKPVLDLCWLTKGLVLVTGATGSGKSTTLATLIDYVNQNRDDHIITIEDPIEFVHPNKRCLVNQREIRTHTSSFKSALRAALREDPDIVLVGEMRDLETIAIAVETAETGHLVFGTLHTTSAPSTVDRIIDQFPSDRQDQIRVMLSESLRGVISQVLCKKVGGGRAAAYEILIGNAAVSNLIREGKTFQLRSVMQTGRKLGMQTMNDHLLDHVKAGIVTPEEAYMKSNDKSLMKGALQAMNIKLDMGGET